MECLRCKKKDVVLDKYQKALDKAIKALATRELVRGSDPVDSVLFDLFVCTQSYARSALDDH